MDILGLATHSTPIHCIDGADRFQTFHGTSTNEVLFSSAGLNERVKTSRPSSFLIKMFELNGRSELMSTIVGPDLETRRSTISGRAPTGFVDLDVIASSKTIVAHHALRAEQPVANDLKSLVGTSSNTTCVDSASVAAGDNDSVVQVGSRLFRRSANAIHAPWSEAGDFEDPGEGVGKLAPGESISNHAAMLLIPRAMVRSFEKPTKWSSKNAGDMLELADLFALHRVIRCNQSRLPVGGIVEKERLVGSRDPKLIKIPGVVDVRRHWFLHEKVLSGF
mmetsp:Transcript_31819/g.93442  ORF Transcript_31819/g.93442 Transcript_31819/m.93442 type:complete len:278 (-) Transcript_31819:360-1193(-)